MPFSDGARIVVEHRHPEWHVQEPYAYRWGDRTIHVPAGSATDFASVPRPFAALVPRWGPWAKAAALHDTLWRQYCPAGTYTWREADRIFREALHELDAPVVRRWMMWAAVRLAAAGKGGQWRDWLATLPAALALVVVTLPATLTAALPTLLALVWLHVLEWPVYAAARLWRMGRRRHGPAPVPPGFDFRTDRRDHRDP